MNGSRILLLGLSYKKGTGDARESPSHVIARHLSALGADLRACDPHVLPVHEPPGVQRVDATVEEVATADAVVLLVDHDDFDYDALVSQAAFVLDCRHRLAAAANVEHL